MDSLGRPAMYPLGAGLTRATLSLDLHASLHSIREAEPVSWVPALGGWLVTSYDLAVEALRDSDRFTVQDERFSTGRVVGPSMLSTDGVEHRTNRKPFETMFRAGPVAEASLAIQKTADHLLDAFVEGRGAELRSDFAAPLAVKVIADFLGLTSMSERPGAEVEVALLNVYRRIVAAVSDLTPEVDVPREASQAVEELNSLILEQCGPHGGPAGPLAVLVAEQPLPLEQLLSNVAVILFGAIETCEAMTANALWHIMAGAEHKPSELVIDPDRLEAFCLGAVGESLRLEPAASVVDRYATEATQLGGASIGERDLVVISLAGANRDPSVFPDPDRFDPDRANSGRNLAFARGPHTCLGTHLARVQTTIGLRRFLSRVPLAVLDVDVSSEPSGLIFRKPERLIATW